MNRRLNDEIYGSLPLDLQRITEKFDNREKDMILLSSLGVLSNCLPNIAGYYDRDLVYPHLYVMIIAPAASGKGVITFSTKLIEPIHNKIVAESREAKVLCEQKKKKDKNMAKESCPNIQVKKVPANISTSELYSFVAGSSHGLLIFETEADTLTNTLKQEWGAFDDVLRKAYHHEPMSISRKSENLFEEISEPKLAVVISGTPGQLKPFLKSRENGLFSRFIYYTFDEISEFKDVFDEEDIISHNEFEDFSNQLFRLYGELAALEKPIIFRFNANQKMTFKDELSFIWQDIIDTHSEAFLTNLKRHGLICFRIAMILSAIRHKENLAEMEFLNCSDEDFETALALTKTLLRHSQVVFDSMDVGLISSQDEDLLDGLPVVFKRNQIIAKGLAMGIPKRTIDDKLAKWLHKKIVRRVKKGEYKILM